MAFCGLLVPAHLRAVDATILEQAGRNAPSLTDRGLALVAQKQLGAAQLLLKAAQQQRAPGDEKLAGAVSALASREPGLVLLGRPEPSLQNLQRTADAAASPPFTDLVVAEANRTRALELLGASSRPEVRELLRCRALTNTVIFSPSQSASGQALDTALCVCGLLLERGYLTKSMSEAVLGLAKQANQGGPSHRLEQALLDFMSLGQRFDWDQLATFVGALEDTETLRLIANVVRSEEGQLPTIFAAVQLSGKPARVAKYHDELQPVGFERPGGRPAARHGGDKGACAAESAAVSIKS